MYIVGRIGRSSWFKVWNAVATCLLEAAATATRTQQSVQSVGQLSLGQIENKMTNLGQMFRPQKAIGPAPMGHWWQVYVTIAVAVAVAVAAGVVLFGCSCYFGCNCNWHGRHAINRSNVRLSIAQWYRMTRPMLLRPKYSHIGSHTLIHTHSHIIQWNSYTDVRPHATGRTERVKRPAIQLALMANTDGWRHSAKKPAHDFLLLSFRRAGK